jgi:hypothetical protein
VTHIDPDGRPGCLCTIVLAAVAEVMGSSRQHSCFLGSGPSDLVTSSLYDSANI